MRLKAVLAIQMSDEVSVDGEVLCHTSTGEELLSSVVE